MTASDNIFLIGFMASGKTTVGRALAARLGLRFVDMDDVIVERAGKTIPRIFAEDGEARFRDLERAVAHDLSARTGLVVATGGGVVLDPDNMRDFHASGLVVRLSASPGTILARVEGDTNRPLLSGSQEEKLHKMLSLLEARRHLYEAISNQIQTDALRVDEIVDKIVSLRHNAT